MPTIVSAIIVMSILAPIGSVTCYAAEASAAATRQQATDATRYCGIRVIDSKTGRGVPLVELETVNHLRWITDSAGWVAIYEPGLMGQQVFFHVRSHGYTFPKDSFGFAGTRVQVESGKKVTLQIQRNNIAERLYRITGEGIYRDSVLLDEPTPLAEPLGGGKVAGQDSAFAELYQGKIFWFWGDTARMSYPLGHFWMACATSSLPKNGGLDPANGVNLTYFTDSTGFSRPVARLGVKKGVVWADGFLTLPDKTGRERLLCHYAHMESLSKMLDHGLAVFNDETSEFERLKVLDMKDRSLFAGQGHPIRYREEDVDYFYFGEVFPNIRVQADWEHYVDPASYEVLTCLESGDAKQDAVLLKDARSRVRYEWRKSSRPIDGRQERQLVNAGRLEPSETHFLPKDVDSDERILLHRGTVRWNDYRRCWVLIAVQQGGSSSFLGEVWYGEAAEPTGPWRRVKKIVTHTKYTFYNPVHHSFFDQDGGRLIYFEGTYANTFSGNPVATPRYNYNQIMYRLDLSAPELKAARPDAITPRTLETEQ